MTFPLGQLDRLGRGNKFDKILLESFKREFATLHPQLLSRPGLAPGEKPKKLDILQIEKNQQ